MSFCFTLSFLSQHIQGSRTSRSGSLEICIQPICGRVHVLFLDLISRSEDRKRRLATQNYRFLILKLKSDSVLYKDSTVGLR